MGRAQGAGQILLISAVKRKAAVRNLELGTEREKSGRRHCTHGGRFHKTLRRVRSPSPLNRALTPYSSFAKAHKFSTINNTLNFVVGVVPTLGVPYSPRTSLFWGRKEMTQIPKESCLKSTANSDSLSYISPSSAARDAPSCCPHTLAESLSSVPSHASCIHGEFQRCTYLPCTTYYLKVDKPDGQS